MSGDDNTYADLSQIERPEAHVPAGYNGREIESGCVVATGGDMVLFLLFADMSFHWNRQVVCKT